MYVSGVVVFGFGSSYGGYHTFGSNMLAKCWQQWIGALCFSCYQSSLGPQQSWKGSNTPSSCSNGRHFGFSCGAVFVLFVFLFCYLRNSWKQAVCKAAAVPRDWRMLSSHQQSSALYCTRTVQAWSSAELKDINREGKLEVHIWHAPSFPWTVCHVVQFWWEHCLRRTKDSAFWIQLKQ